METREVKIALGVITHRQLDGLLQLLESFARVNVPAGTTCTVLIAENDETSSLRGSLDLLRATVPFGLELSLETERGIPFARNHVLDMAIKGGFDFLTFVDDDQIIHEDWLVMLYATATGRRCDLVGGPRIFIADENTHMTRENEVVLRHWKHLSLKMRAGRANKVCTPREQQIHVYTNNWMLRLSRQQALGVRFDEKLRFTGGSDTKFCTDFAALGGKIGWSSDAVTYEIWPADRLTYSYLYRRKRDHTITHLMRANHRPSLLRYLLLLNRSLVFGSANILCAPFNNFKSLPAAVQSFGVVAGYMRAARGISSSLYTPPEVSGKGPASQ